MKIRLECDLIYGYYYFDGDTKKFMAIVPFEGVAKPLQQPNKTESSLALTTLAVSCRVQYR